ncbi:MAG: hypothetical protein ACXVGC_10210 [Mycobacteriaceae bacterium]
MPETVQETTGRRGTIIDRSKCGFWWTVEWEDGQVDELSIACFIPSDRVHVLGQVER